MYSKIRMLITNILYYNKNYCWAELVVWAFYYDSESFMKIFNKNNFKLVCKKSENVSAYCGKCEKTGMYYKD